MTRTHIIEIARSTLTPEQLDVWTAKHVYGYGRRRGSLALRITEEQWRYRLLRATLRVNAELQRRKDTA